MTGNLVHRLVGYDQRTERVSVEYEIPAERLSQVKWMAEVDPDDPDAIYSYPLDPRTARIIGRIIGQAVDAEHLDFFLEPFPEAEQSKQSSGQAGSHSN